MTSNIIVFKAPEINGESNKTEKELQYESFIKNESLPIHHYPTFLEMDTQTELSIKTQSTIPAILIKDILSYCIPIIKKVPDFTVKTKTVDVFKKEKVDERTVEKYYNISLQLDYPINVRFEYDSKNSINEGKIKELIIPNGTSFNVIGVIIPKSFNKIRDNSFLNYVYELGVNDILMSGKYGLEDFQSYFYTQSRIDSLKPNGKDEYKIYFNSDTDSKSKIKIICDYINYVENFYANNLIMLYRYIQIEPFTVYLKNVVKKYNIFNGEYKPTIIKQNPISVMISKLINTRLGDTSFSNDFMFYKNNIFDLVHKVMILGLNNDVSKRLLQTLDLNRFHENNMIEFRKMQFTEMLKNAKKKSISIRKFNIYSLDELTDAQNKIVELEFSKMEKYYASLFNYSSDFKIINSLYWAVNNERYNLIKECLGKISDMVKIPADITNPKLEMLQNKDKINMICPHIIAKAQLIIEKSYDKVTKYGKIREFLINNFSLPVTDDGYFCRICGEMIAESDEEDIMKYISGKRVSFVMEYDRLKNQIWNEVSHIMTSYVKFKNSVNIKSIITSVVETLRSEMGIIEVNLSKIKSNSKDSIKDLMSIYISVYTFAIVAHMINKNYGLITFSSRGDPSNTDRLKKPKDKTDESPLYETDKPNTTEESPLYQTDKPNTTEESPLYETDKPKQKDELKKETPKRDKQTEKQKDKPKKEKQTKTKKTSTGGDSKTHVRIQNIINNALFLILKTKNITINNITSITPDTIKSILIKAYKWASNLQSDESNIKKTEDAVNITNENIFKYIEYVINMNQYYKKQAKNKKNNTIEEVLGRSWKTIIEEKDDKSIYETINTVNEWGDTEEIKYKYGSFRYITDYIKEKIYAKNAVPYSINYIELDKKYKFVLDAEKKIDNILKKPELRPFNKFDLNSNYMIKFNNFRESNIKIEKFYDNDGNKHKFDIIIFQSANNKGMLSGSKKEYFKKDIVEWFKKSDMKKIADFKNMFIIDVKCSICNTLLSNVKNKNIETAIDKIDDVRSFYDYYENRCPNGELHEFIISAEKNKNNNCSKCGISNDIVNKLDKKFYDKFIPKYSKVIAEKLRIEKGEMSSLINIKKDKIAKSNFSEWKINNAPMLEISRTFKVKYNVWINLGLSVNQKFSDIENEKINPSSTLNSDINNLRLIQLQNYYLFLVRIFYTIKNYDIVNNLSYTLKQIMAKNKIRDLKDKLVDIDTNILLKFNYYKTYSELNIATNFILYSISNTIMEIYKSMKKASVNIADEIIMYIINSIIDSEKALSEPDLTKFSATVVASNLEEISTENIAEISDTEGDEVQNNHYESEESEAEIENIVDEEPNNEFDLGDMDIEMDEEENISANPMDF